jgi:hypothetical protein
MQDLTSFIQQEKQKREMEQQPKQNVKMSLLDLKRAVDSGSGLLGNPLVESIKKIENKIEPVVGGNVTEQKTVKRSPNQEKYAEKEDEFTKQLLMKTREFMVGKESSQNITENYNTEAIEPRYVHPNKMNPSNNLVPKESVMDVLKDTMLELYVKERVEGILKEYLTSNEGKQMIKSIVVNLFKKK